MRFLLLLVPAVVLVRAPFQAREAPECFRILPVETALQRHLLDLSREGGPACFLSVFGNDALGEDGAVHLDGTLLVEELLECTAGEGTVAITLEYESPFTVGLEEDPRADRLIGSKAPDFFLEALDIAVGRTSLHELAETKVTLLTFWGVG